MPVSQALIFNTARADSRVLSHVAHAEGYTIPRVSVEYRAFIEWSA
jgi:hypothetical protein